MACQNPASTRPFGPASILGPPLRAEPLGQASDCAMTTHSNGSGRHSQLAADVLRIEVVSVGHLEDPAFDRLELAEYATHLGLPLGRDQSIEGAFGDSDLFSRVPLEGPRLTARRARPMHADMERRLEQKAGQRRRTLDAPRSRGLESAPQGFLHDVLGRSPIAKAARRETPNALSKAIELLGLRSPR